MVKIRLSPKGRKGQRSYWIIAIDARKARDSGNYLEYLGFHNPYSKETRLEKENIKKWLERGAQPSDRVKSLFKKHL